MRTRHPSAAFRGAALFAGALLLALPCVAGAASLLIKPSQLHPYSSQQPSIQTQYFVSGGYALPSPGFWYPLDLPVGTVITGLSYQHGSQAGQATGVAVIRVKPDATPAAQNVYLGGSNVATVTNFEFITVPCPIVAGAATTVEAGWRYAVGVWTTIGTSFVGNIKVSY